MKIQFHYKPGASRATRVVSALTKGFKEHGDVVVTHGGEVQFFYGMSPANVKRMANANKYFVIDLAYWNRGQPTSESCHYKICFQSHHPDAYFLDLPTNGKRFNSFNKIIHPWKPITPSKPILLAGMGPKSNTLYGYADWDAQMVAQLRTMTKRKILYRPKPSDKSPRPIEGAELVSASTPINSQLQSVHAVVTHHSNVAVDGLLQGVPCVAKYGPASLVPGDLLSIENPLQFNRKEFFNRLSYCQWSITEMASGEAWNWLRTFHLRK